MKSKRGYRRGYPVAILVGLEENQAVLWRIFSKVVKPEKTLRLDGNRKDPKILYNFHEAVVNALRPTLKEGVKSIILASAARTDYTQKFTNHIHGHHAWLVQGSNKAVFTEITGSAATPSEVATLTRSSTFQQQISETTTEETENLIQTLEKRLYSPNQDTPVLCGLEEAENLILPAPKRNGPEPEYLMLTDKYLQDSPEKGRIQRLIQIATNKRVKTRIVTAESTAGQRLTQLGGLVCIAKP